MRNPSKKTLLISSLLISTNHADNFSDLGAYLTLKASQTKVLLPDAFFSPRENAKADTSSRAELYKP